MGRLRRILRRIASLQWLWVCVFVCIIPYGLGLKVAEYYIGYDTYLACVILLYVWLYTMLVLLALSCVGLILPELKDANGDDCKGERSG